jgi:hypothetical protein
MARESATFVAENRPRNIERRKKALRLVEIECGAECRDEVVNDGH